MKSALFENCAGKSNHGKSWFFFPMLSYFCAGSHDRFFTAGSFLRLLRFGRASATGARQSRGGKHGGARGEVFHPRGFPEMGVDDD